MPSSCLAETEELSVGEHWVTWLFTRIMCCFGFDSEAEGLARAEHSWEGEMKLGKEKALHNRGMGNEPHRRSIWTSSIWFINPLIPSVQKKKESYSSMSKFQPQPCPNIWLFLTAIPHKASISSHGSFSNSNSCIVRSPEVLNSCTSHCSQAFVN